MRQVPRIAAASRAWHASTTYKMASSDNHPPCHASQTLGIGCSTPQTSRQLSLQLLTLKQQSRVARLFVQHKKGSSAFRQTVTAKHCKCMRDFDCKPGRRQSRLTHDNSLSSPQDVPASNTPVFTTNKNAASRTAA